MTSQPCLAGPFCLATHIQDGQPGPAGSLLAGACTRGPAVMSPSGLAFQLPPTKCTFTAVTHLSSRSDVRTSVATQKPRMLQYPREGPASLPHVETWLFGKQPEALLSGCAHLENLESLKLAMPRRETPEPAALLPL